MDREHYIHNLVQELGLNKNKKILKILRKETNVKWDEENTYSVNDKYPTYLKRFNGHYPFLLALIINQIDVEHVEYFYEKGFRSNKVSAPIGFDGEDVQINEVDIFFMALGGYDKDTFDKYKKYFSYTSMNVYDIEFYGKGINMNHFSREYFRSNWIKGVDFYRPPAKEEVFFHYKFQDQESDTYDYPNFKSARKELDSFIIDSLIPDELDTWRMNRVQLVEIIESNGYTPEEGLDRTDLLDIIDENGWVPMLEVKMNNLKEINGFKTTIVVNSRGLLNDIDKWKGARRFKVYNHDIWIGEYFINGIRHSEHYGLDIQNMEEHEQDYEVWKFGKLVGQDYGIIKYVSSNNYGFGNDEYT